MIINFQPKRYDDELCARVRVSMQVYVYVNCCAERQSQ